MRNILSIILPQIRINFVLSIDDNGLCCKEKVIDPYIQMYESTLPILLRKKHFRSLILGSSITRDVITISVNTDRTIVTDNTIVKNNPISYLKIHNLSMDRKHQTPDSPLTSETPIGAKTWRSNERKFLVFIT